jgi:hypothetical protein
MREKGVNDERLVQDLVQDLLRTRQTTIKFAQIEDKLVYRSTLPLTQIPLNTFKVR